MTRQEKGNHPKTEIDGPEVGENRSDVWMSLAQNSFGFLESTLVQFGTFLGLTEPLIPTENSRGFDKR
jgi:hypothetical protein